MIAAANDFKGLASRDLSTLVYGTSRNAHTVQTLDRSQQYLERRTGQAPRRNEPTATFIRATHIDRRTETAERLDEIENKSGCWQDRLRWHHSFCESEMQRGGSIYRITSIDPRAEERGKLQVLRFAKPANARSWLCHPERIRIWHSSCEQISS